jgi:fatty acid desaturase
MTVQHGQIESIDITFSDEERMRLRSVVPHRLILDLFLPWLQAILGCAVFIVHPGLWTWLIAVLFIAGAQHGLSMITHEAAHRLIWPQDKRINDFIAAYLFAAPVVLPFQVYRKRHLIHHQQLSREDDTKTLYRRSLSGWRFFFEILRSISGIDYCQQALEAMRYGQGQDSDQFKQQLRHGQCVIVFVHVILFLLFLLVDPLHFGLPTYYVILWLAPLPTLSFLFGKLRSIAEHHPLVDASQAGMHSPYFMETSLPVARSIKANWIERLFLSKIHFHFHAEHHLWPWISYQHLPQINARIWQGGTGRKAIKNNLIYMERSYTRILYRLYRGG